MHTGFALSCHPGNLTYRAYEGSDDSSTEYMYAMGFLAYIPILCLLASQTQFLVCAGASQQLLQPG